MKIKKKKNKAIKDIIKATRKEKREEEIRLHGKPINYRKIIPSAKIYNRKRNNKTEE